MWESRPKEVKEWKWFFTNGLIDFPSEGLGEFLDDKSKDQRDGGALIYYHVRRGLFIKPQVLVAQLWHAEWWLMEVEDDESHAVYGGLSFYLPLCLHQSLIHSPPTPPQPTNNNLSAFLWAASAQCLSFSCDFSDHQDAGLKGSSVKHQPATTTSCTRQPSEEFGFKALLSPAFSG